MTSSIAASSLKSDVVKGADKQFPNVKFTEIDDPKRGVSNIYSTEYNTSQAGFFADYLAVGMSKAGIVGAWGDQSFLPMAILYSYMDGC